MDAVLRAAFCCLLFATCMALNVEKQCEPHAQRSAKTLPKLPNAFTSMVELNIVNKNYTTLLMEYYDGAGNRGAVTKMSGRGNGENIHEIFDYSSNEVISIDKVSGQCRVYPLSNYNFLFFGLRQVNDKRHIEGVTQVLKFGNEFNETYMGTESVRGIICDHWQACVNTPNSSYTIDYYFASSAWNNSQKSSVTPVRAVFNGSTTSTLDGKNTPHSFYRVYDCFSFKPGTPDAEQYQIPRGTFCPGKKNTFNGALPAPKWFSFDAEWVSERHKNIRSFREFYDSELKLVRIDHQNDSINALVTEVHDFNTGVRYFIYNTTGVRRCKITVLNKLHSSMDDMEFDTHYIRLKTGTAILFVQDYSKFGYQGVAKIRGFEADVFATRWQNPDETAEIYFLRKNWVVKNDAGLEERQTPIRWTVNSHRGKWVSNIYNFDASPQDVGVFDITACYSWSQKHQFNLKFGPLNKNFTVDEKVFGKALRKTIAVLGKVMLIRIADIKIWRYPPEFDSLRVTFTLLDQPTEGVEGLAVQLTGQDSPTTIAVKNLKDGVTQKQFVVTFQASDGSLQQLTADPNIFATDGKPGFTNAPTRSSMPSKGGDPDTLSKKNGEEDSDKVLTKGEVAGLVIGMLLLGLILGVIFTLLFKKCGTSTNFSFKRQNEPSIPM